LGSLSLKWILSLVGLVTLLVPGAGVATSVVYNMNSGGITAASLCLTEPCALGSDVTFDQSSGPVDALAGTVTLDTNLLTISFSLAGVSTTLAEVVAGADNDNGVASVILTTTTFSATGASVLDLGSGIFAFGPGSTASVAGTQTQLAPGGGLVAGPAAFAMPTAQLTGNCLVIGGTISCTQMFGRTGAAFGVGAPAQTRFLRAGTSITGAVVPEPGTAWLVGGGLSLIGLMRRRRAEERRIIGAGGLKTVAILRMTAP